MTNDQGPVEGWAVIDKNGVVLVRTVSPSRRAAIINWLYTEAHMLITNSMDDDYIEQLWQSTPRRGAEVVRVLISVGE
jgi:hypothetical protein